MEESKMPLFPTSHPVLTANTKKHYNKAFKEMLRMMQTPDWSDNITDCSHELSQLRVEEDPNDVYPLDDFNTHLHTDTDVTLPSHLVSNAFTEPSLENNNSANKLNLRKSQNSFAKIPGVFTSEVRDIYEELSKIYQKLQKERISQHAYSLQLKKRELCLQEREDMLFKHQAALCRIKGVEEIVHEKFWNMKEQYDAEVKQLSDALKERIKENKRLKSSFDTLKEMNDSLKKQLNEVSEQNRKLEIQARKVQSRLENLQRKQAFLSVQKCKDISQVMREPKPQKIEKIPASIKPKVAGNANVYKLLVVLMDWLSAVEQNGSKDKLSIEKLPTNSVQEQYVQILPVIMEQFEWMPLVSTKLHLSFMRLTYWTLRKLDNGTQSTVTSTLRRIGDETYKGVVYHPSEETATEKKSKSAAFFRSNNLPLRFISTLVVLKTVTQVDYLAQALDSLCMDLKTEEGRALFLEYQAVPAFLHLLHVTNRGLISSVFDILLQLSMETKFLQPFLESCSTESFFGTSAALLKDPKVDVQMLEKLSVVLQKLSQVRSNKKFFDTFNISQIIQEMKRTTNPDHAFLVINLNSILFHLGVAKSKTSFPNVSENND